MPLWGHNKTICAMFPSNFREKINKESFVRYLKLTVVKSHKIFLYTRQTFLKLFDEDRSKQAINSTCRQGCSIAQICSSSCSFQLLINLLPVPSVVQFSSNYPTIWSERVDLITSPDVEASGGIDAEIVQIIAPTQRQYRVVSVESRT